MLVSQAADAQHDIVELYSPYLRHYFTGRQNLTLYDSKAGYKWDQCIWDPFSSSTSFSSGTIPKQTAGSAALRRQGFIIPGGLLILVFMVLTSFPKEVF